MKLKEQFNNLVPSEFGGMQEPLLTNCVDVAKDFAIGFAEWTQKNAYGRLRNSNWIDKNSEVISSETLLLRYITEKNL